MQPSACDRREYFGNSGVDIFFNNFAIKLQYPVSDVLFILWF